MVQLRHRRKMPATVLPALDYDSSSMQSAGDSEKGFDGLYSNGNRVRFNFDRCEVHTNSSVSEGDLADLWYDNKDLEEFKLMAEVAAKDVFNNSNYSQALQSTYVSCKDSNALVTDADSMEENSGTIAEAVGLEYLLLGKYGRDRFERREALSDIVVFGMLLYKKKCRKNGINLEDHVRERCEKISWPSQVFARKIASIAQRGES